MWRSKTLSVYVQAPKRFLDNKAVMFKEQICREFCDFVVVVCRHGVESFERNSIYRTYSKGYKHI